MSNVIHLQVDAGEGVRIPAENVLTGAVAADLADVVVLGREADGSIYVASNIGNGATMLLIEQAKLQTLLESMEVSES